MKSKLSKLNEELTTPDYEVTTSLSPKISTVEWQVTFVCPSGWNWTDDAPHSWFTMSPGKIYFKIPLLEIILNDWHFVTFLQKILRKKVKFSKE